MSEPLTPAGVLADWRAGLPHTRSVWTDRLAGALEETLELLDVFVGDRARAYYKAGGHVTVHVTDEEWRRACTARAGRAPAAAAHAPVDEKPKPQAGGKRTSTQVGPDDPWPEEMF